MGLLPGNPRQTLDALLNRDPNLPPATTKLRWPSKDWRYVQREINRLRRKQRLERNARERIARFQIGA